MWLGWLVACWSGPTSPPRAPPHYEEWPDLVTAAILGREDHLARYARDLAGPEDEALGAALGWLQVATAEERPEALVAAGRACRACHLRLEARPAAAGPTSHEEAARWLARALVAGVEGSLESPGGPLAVPEPQACAGCHRAPERGQGQPASNLPGHSD
jgi:hypothetical protein